MIRTVDLDDNTESLVQTEGVRGLDLSNIWLQLVEPTEDELQVVSYATQVPINFLRLPKTSSVVNLRLEKDFGIINFLVLQDVPSTKKTHPIVMAFSKKFLITVTTKEIEQIIVTVKERMSKTRIDPPSQVTYFIIDEIVAHHYMQIEKLENLTAKMEEEVVEKTSPDTLKRIFKLKSNMISFNKILWYERGLVFDLKKYNGDCMDAETRGLFDSTHEELTRQVDIVETYREILSDAINVHLSAISNKINLSIKALTIVIFYLTIVTTITSFPNTVATFFGISQFGNTNTLIISAALFASIVLPFVWLWRKKWLTSKRLEY
jgi:Mg2+ and Co2+ transporter CorA